MVNDAFLAMVSMVEERLKNLKTTDIVFSSGSVPSHEEVVAQYLRGVEKSLDISSPLDELSQLWTTHFQDDLSDYAHYKKHWLAANTWLNREANIDTLRCIAFLTNRVETLYSAALFYKTMCKCLLVAFCVACVLLFFK